jgi:deoxycytidine triphosphate deaminase
MSGLLNGQEIKASDLIEGASDRGYRAASYDVRIGQIVGPDGELLDSYLLPPQGVVEVISQERMKLPTGISGYALVKTGLCNEGVLALNIGIIDPGYDGLLSSALVNFSKKGRLLLAGETFLRLTFHRVAETNGQSRSVPMKNEEYIADKRRKVAENFPKHFLNVDELVDHATNDAVKKLRSTFFWGVPLTAVGLALLTFFINFGVIWTVQRAFNPINTVETDQLQTELGAQNELLRASLRDSQAANQQLTERIDRLEQQLTSLKPGTPAPKPTSP